MDESLSWLHDVEQEKKRKESTVKAFIPDSQWHPIYKDHMETGSEWAEVCFIPNELCHSKNAPEYRYLAKRQILKDQQFPKKIRRWI